MKITPSSSLLLATLAISSSSSSLAAPTEQPHEHALSSSSSTQLSSRQDSMNIQTRGGGAQVEMHGQRPESVHPHDERPRPDLDKRATMGGTLTDVLGAIPVIGGPLVELVQSLVGSAGESAISQESIDKVQQVIQAIGSASPPLNGSSVSRNAARDDATPSAVWPSSTQSFAALEMPAPPVSPPVSPPAPLSPPGLPVSPPGPPVSPGSPPGPPVSPGSPPISPPMPVNPPNTPVAPGHPAAPAAPAAKDVPVDSQPPTQDQSPCMSPNSTNGTAAKFDSQPTDGGDAPPLFASSTANGTSSTRNGGSSTVFSSSTSVAY
ncbi:uncharacterized protein FIBRA_00142 [Fibroporia radiculosa]|uniref:Uncharacterized protein n=1 Tax=Fibroporia radiculosa TaxID=599839 RepID=J7SCI7_9APHY|nr:uncharacterized protein FIBRA_00142 [Fibroporia radiculosa]CCL98148.1 predicted protein [Fibroporia radiculosa]